MVKLTRGQRNELIRKAHAYKREHDAWHADVADYIATLLFEDEERYGIVDVEAIEVSDYAYSLANFICPRETV